MATASWGGIPTAGQTKLGGSAWPIVPRPVLAEPINGTYQMVEKTTIYVDVGQPEVRAIGEYFAEHLRARTGWPIPVRELTPELSVAVGDMLLTLKNADAALGDEGYDLAVKTHLRLKAREPRGLFWGVQTIRQLLPPVAEGAAPGGAMKCVHIGDRPRYRWRGMLLDCGRHFMSKEFVKRYIDLLAYHKLNVLHWHLTEDQGWRIEIKKYPKLTEIGAWRAATRDDEQPRDAQGRYGGFYSHEDIREIVAYAAARYVAVVPEIEMPGHALAALASYPELSCTGGPFQVGTQWGVLDDVYCPGNERVFEFLEGVLGEVLELFPSEFIHIGGDECPKRRWQACPKCQARIKAENLKDERELQSYFIRRIEQYLHSRGRRLIGWDEILEGGLAPNATVQSWRGMDGAVAAATAGHDVISSPTSHCYLDYAQARTPGEPTVMGFIDLEKVYAFEPTPLELSPEQARHVLGAEGNIWTEHAPQARVDWQVFPRLCALAEVTWSHPDARHWDDFRDRLRTHYQRLDALGVTYFIPPPEAANRDSTFSDSIEVTLAAAIPSGEIRYTLDGSTPTASSPKYTAPFELRETKVVKARTFMPGGRASDVAELRFEKSSPP